MTDDGGASQPLQNSDLDLLRPQTDEPVESGSEALEGFSRQPRDQIGMNMNAGLLSQKSEIVLETSVILAALNQAPDFFIEGLNAHLKLERSCWEFRDHLPQTFR